MSTKLRLGALLAITIIVGACGGTATTAPAATGTLAAATPAATPAVTVAATVAATATAAAATPTAAATPEAPTPGVTAAPTPVPTPVVACASGATKITFWTKEGAESLKYVQQLASDYCALHPDVSFTVVNKDVESLRQDFQTSSLANNPPDLLWTVSDHVGPFTAADLIMPFDGLIDTATYIPNTLDAVTADGHLWGVPISNGNQLMLLWNKSLAGATAPTDSNALVEAAKTNTDAAAGKYGLVFNQTESFWLVPFLGAFGGSVFAADGVTPTLNTDAMKSALTLLHDWKFKDQIAPPEADYNGADGLFKAGKAAFIINGDWSLADYSKDAVVGGANLGVGALPMITGADYPKPYTAGSFFMASKKVADDPAKQAVILDFIKWVTSKDEQVDLVKVLQRLPANAEALADPVVTGNPLLAGAADAVTKGVPQPTNLQMRCVFDSMTTGVRDLFAKSDSDPAAIAAAMQTSADAGVAPGGECSE